MSSSLDKLFSDAGVEYIQGYVTRLSPQDRKLDIEAPNSQTVSLSYDKLILAAGSSLNLPNIPGLKEHTYNVDTLANAARLDAHLGALALRPCTKARNSVVVCGGGFTGIEVAAEMPGRLAAILGSDAEFQITIVEQQPDIGPELGPGPRPVILQALRNLNVKLELGESVAQVDAGGIVTASGKRLEASTIIWTGGMRATPLTKQIAGEQDKLGRLVVDEYLRVPTAQDIFATGDAAHAVTDKEGHVALMSCQHALVLGRYSGYNAAADLLGLAPKKYTQETYGTCLALGGYGAVVTDGWDRKVTTHGRMAGMVKQFVNAVLISPPSTAREAFQVSHPDFTLPSLDDGVSGFLLNRNRGALFVYAWRFLVWKLFGTVA
jgi:NADH dehydrogenase